MKNLRAFELVGYRLSSQQLRISEQSRRRRRLQEILIAEIERLFPNEAQVSFVRNRPVFSLVDGSAAMPISICHCYKTRVEKELRWTLRVPPRDRHLTTLVCLSNLTRDGFEALYVVRGVEIGAKCTIKGDSAPLFRRGQRLSNLTDLCMVARTIDQREKFAEGRPRTTSQA